MTTAQADTTAQAALMRLLTAKWSAPVIGVLADLGIADQLTDGPRSADSLASSVGAHPGALRRVLRAAVSLGVFTQDDEGRFGLDPLAEWLRTDTPGSLRPAALTFSLEPLWVPYAHIRHSVLTGEPAFDRHYGESVYEYFARHPEVASVFGAAAASFHATAIEAIATAHDFSRYGTVVDVGGGTGTLLAAILRHRPSVRGVLFELPDVLRAAPDTFQDPDLRGRVELVAGNFFESVPKGDAFVIKSCLHNFADEQAIAILRVIRRAMSEQATLIVAETIVPDGNGPHYAKLDDVEMLVIAGGADRDEREYRRLLAAAGFVVHDVTPCGDRFSLIEARVAP